jgi:hypothetical protein
MSAGVSSHSDTPLNIPSPYHQLSSNTWPTGGIFERDSPFSTAAKVSAYVRQGPAHGGMCARPGGAVPSGNRPPSQGL